ncbi:hypothetical protein LXL04_013144 [Taraxacum kok-saghyz]
MARVLVDAEGNEGEENGVAGGEDETLREDSEIALKQELAWASHLSLQACLLPTPKGRSCGNYARCVNQILDKYQRAVSKALLDRISDENASTTTIVLMVVGAGQGPLVRASLQVKLHKDLLHFETVARTANTAVEVKKDKMALAAIYQSIPEDLLLGLAEKKSSKEAWEALKTQFMGEERVRTARIQTLKAEFESLNMKESEGVDEFAMKVCNIVSTMRALGDMVEESYVVKKLLRAVPSKFLQIASTLEQFGDLDKMTV